MGRAALALALSLAIAGCGGADDEPEPDPGAGHLIVSIGDSVASGEGNPQRPARPGERAGWLNRRCHRSSRSGQALAAIDALGAETGFRTIACSGATIEQGLLGPYLGIEHDGKLEMPQVEVLAADAAGGAEPGPIVLVSVGANDIGFQRIVQHCALPPAHFCAEKPFDPDPHQPGPKLPLEEYIEQALQDLASGYERLADALGEITAPERVVIVEYFDPTTAPNGSGCRMLLGGITPAESVWAREQVLAPLNERIRESAGKAGWTYVDGVDEAFAGHGLCAGDQSWVVTAGESISAIGIPLLGDEPLRERLSGLLGSYKGTLHPNAKGHRATADLIAPVLDELLAGG